MMSFNHMYLIIILDPLMMVMMLLIIYKFLINDIKKIRDAQPILVVDVGADQTRRGGGGGWPSMYSDRL